MHHAWNRLAFDCDQTVHLAEVAGVGFIICLFVYISSTSFGAVYTRFLTLLARNPFTVESEKKAIIFNFCRAIRNTKNDFDFLYEREQDSRNELTLNTEHSVRCQCQRSTLVNSKKIIIIPFLVFPAFQMKSRSGLQIDARIFSLIFVRHGYRSFGEPWHRTDGALHTPRLRYTL